LRTIHVKNSHMDMTAEDPEDIYRTCYALSSMTRINIIKILSLNPMTVTSLSEALKLTKGNVSNQVASLEEAGLVESTFEPGIKGVKKVLKPKYEKIVLILT